MATQYLELRATVNESVLTELRIIGGEQDLRLLALGILEAIDKGRTKLRVGDTKVKVKCEGSGNCR